MSFLPDKAAGRAVSAPVRRPSHLLALLISAAYAFPASAALVNDNIHPYVSTVYVHDDNILRLSDGESVNGQRSDNYKQAIAGVDIEQPFGHQVLSVDLRVSRVTFDHFDEYNYNGKDAKAQLAWQLGNHVTGHAGGSYSQTLAPFSDFNTTERNLRVQRKEFVDANWLFHPSWQVHGGYTREQYRYDLALQRYNNRDEDTAEGGVDYLTSGGSRVGVLTRHIKGEYPDGTLLGFLVSDNYKQDEVKLNVSWRYSAITQLQFQGGYAKREHSVYTSRDQSGVNGRVRANWAPLVRLTFTGAAWREFYAVEGSTVNSSLSKGVSLESNWEVTSKLKLNGQWRYEKRDFNAISSSVVADPHDATRSASLTLSYTPLPILELDAGISHNKRDGNFAVGSGNYKSNSANFSARLTF